MNVPVKLTAFVLFLAALLFGLSFCMAADVAKVKNANKDLVEENDSLRAELTELKYSTAINSCIASSEGQALLKRCFSSPAGKELLDNRQKLDAELRKKYNLGENDSIDWSVRPARIVRGSKGDAR